MTQLTITLRERERERIPNLILRIQLSGTCKLQYNMYKPMITKLHWQVLIIFTRWGIWYTKMTEGPKKVKEKKKSWKQQNSHPASLGLTTSNADNEQDKMRHKMRNSRLQGSLPLAQVCDFLI